MYRNIVTNKYFFPLALILLTFITYLNILPNQLFYDDEELIYKNTYIQNLKYFPKYFTQNMIAGAGKTSNMYRPILLTSFALDYAIWKNNPVGYHLTSIILHGVNAVLIFFLIFKLFNNRLLSFFSAFFFAVHPVQTEAVIYASGRTDLLFSLFFLISILLYIRSKYLFSILFFIPALLSKETAVILPAILILLVILTPSLSRRKNPQQNLRIPMGSFSRVRLGRRMTENSLVILMPYIFIIIIYIILRLTILNFANTLNFYQNQNLYSQNLLIRLYTFTGAFFRYLKIIFFPKDLIFSRETPIITSFVDIRTILFLLTTSIITVISVRSWQRGNKLFLFSLLWFFATIFPVSGIIPINSIIAEHYLYLPSLAFFLVVSSVFVSIWRKYQKLNNRILLASTILMVYLLLSVRTYMRAFDWRDPVTFYTKSLKQSPLNIPMRHNLAMSYADRGNYDLAIKEYQFIIKNSDVYPNTHHNLAHAYQAIGKYKEAEEEYYNALEMDPNFHFSLYALADLYEKTNQQEKLMEVVNRINNLTK